MYWKEKNELELCYDRWQQDHSNSSYDKMLTMNIKKLNTQGVTKMLGKTSWVSSSCTKKYIISYRKYMSGD
jgi:hypothetical protein